MQWSSEKNGASQQRRTMVCGESELYQDPDAERGTGKDENSVFYYYQKLIRLRKRKSSIWTEEFDLLLPEDEKIFAYTRTDEHTKILVCANFTDEVNCPVLDEWKGRESGFGIMKDDREGNVLRHMRQ